MGQMDDIAAIRAMVEAMQRKLDAVVMQPRPDWVTAKDYAELCGVTPRTVRNWINSGELETYKNGSKVMVRASQAASQGRRQTIVKRQ